MPTHYVWGAVAVIVLALAILWWWRKFSHDRKQRKSLESLGAIAGAMREYGHARFEVLDTDGDGQITLDDLQQALEKRKGAVDQRFLKLLVNNFHLVAEVVGTRQVSAIAGTGPMLHMHSQTLPVKAITFDSLEELPARVNKLLGKPESD